MFGARSHRDGRFRVRTLVAGAVAVAAVASAAPLASAAPMHRARSPYADSGWVTKHGDAGNRKQQLGVTPAAHYEGWAALDGASVLAAPTIGTNGDIFVTTGLGAGRSNLHAFRPDGRLDWAAPAWNGRNAPDSCAVIASPTVDRHGNIYLSDCDQLWSYSGRGRLRWVIDLPTAPPGAPFQQDSTFNPLSVDAVLTPAGDVLGVTAFGQVLLVDWRTGRRVAADFQLPGALAPRATMPLPPTTFAPDFLDARIRDPIWQIAFGGVFRSNNTPAVDERTGRVFLPATDVDPALGAMYALDVVAISSRSRSPHERRFPHERYAIRLAFATRMGPGSGSSPTLSPDRTTVYASDNAGILWAFDTGTGRVRWSVPSGSEAGSMAVGPNGDVYVLVRNGITAAFAQADGRKLWDADLTRLTAETLPMNPTLGRPNAIGGGTVTVAHDAIVMSIVYGYVFPIAGRNVNVPVRTAIAEIDPATGVGRRNLVFTESGNEATLPISPDGLLIHAEGAIATTAIAPLAATINPLLADGLHVIPPDGGLEVFRPS